METLYDWLKRKKEQGNEHRRVTLIYNDSILKLQKVRIKPKPYGCSGHYMTTIVDEKRPVYHEIEYLLRFIEKELLCDYYVTSEGMIEDPYSTTSEDYIVAYKLEISDKLHILLENSVYGIKPKNPAYINPLSIDPIDCVRKEDLDTFKKLVYGAWDSKKRLDIEKVTINGPATVIFWKDGTKTVAKCDKDDVLDYEKGILYAALKKLCDKKEYNDILRLVDAWSEYNSLHPDLFPDRVEAEKPKKKVYKRKFGDSDQNCPNCGQNWIWSNNRRLSFFRDGFINITCRNCGHKFRYVKGGRYENQ